MVLRGISLKASPVLFDLKDCPVVLNSELIALINRPYSPLLRADSIVLGDEENGLFEGDYVFGSDKHNLIGYIIYLKGFKVLDARTNEVLELKDIGDYYTRVNSSKRGLNIIKPYRFRIEYKYQDYTFDISKLLRVDNGIITIYKKLLEPIKIEDVKLCTGFTDNGDVLSYGDVYGDGVICYHDLKPMIRTSKNSFIDIVEREEITDGCSTIDFNRTRCELPTR